MRSSSKYKTFEKFISASSNYVVLVCDITHKKE